MRTNLQQILAFQVVALVDYQYPLIIFNLLCQMRNKIHLRVSECLVGIESEDDDIGTRQGLFDARFAQ